MGRTLVIIPTKDRLEYMISMLGNLMCQKGDFDVFIGDMSTQPGYLSKSWLFEKMKARLVVAGHNVIHQKVEGHNQLFGYQAGLEFAKMGRYAFFLGSDDDITFEPGWIEQGVKTLKSNASASTVVGVTLLPWLPLARQTCPPDYDKDVAMQGRLTEDDVTYSHCVLIPRDNAIRDYEQVYGAFLGRVNEYVSVDGFPTYLSPLGFRGEMMAQCATTFNNRLLLLDPTMISYHFSAQEGGLRLVQGTLREQGLAHDRTLFAAFVRRGQPTTRRPEGF